MRGAAVAEAGEKEAVEAAQESAPRKHIPKTVARHRCHFTRRTSFKDRQLKPSVVCPFKNICGQPYILQIRSQVSNVGDRVPSSSSRYSLTLTPKRHAAWHSRIPLRVEHVGERCHDRHMRSSFGRAQRPRKLGEHSSR
jgi:hypothetical protein